MIQLTFEPRVYTHVRAHPSCDKSILLGVGTDITQHIYKQNLMSLISLYVDGIKIHL